jgi:polysaccharide pyruvyl transferase CsaB
MAKPRVFLVGYYGVHNLGDEAIREAIQVWADGHGVEIAWYATRDPHDRDPRAVRLGDRRSIRYMAACWRADRLVLGGGGILKDEGLRLPLELLVTALVARLAGTSVSLLSVGVGPFYTRVGRWMTSVVARLARVRTVRDDASAQALAELGVYGVEVAADPIFSLLESGASRVKRSSTDGRRPIVVVSVRPWFHKVETGGADRWRHLCSAVARRLDGLVEAGWGVRFVSMYWPRDRDAAAEVLGLMTGGTAAEIDSRPLSWPDLIEVLASANLCLAMRYHAVAAASLARAPVVGLIYEPKVAELVRALGLPAIGVDSDDLETALPRLVAQAASDPGASTAASDRIGLLNRRAITGLERSLRDG